MRFVVPFALLVLSAPLAPATAFGAPEDDFSSGVAALEGGEVQLALRHFERMADRGERDVAASFNRGLAYLKRAESPSKELGDLGQAATAFVEVLELSPGDHEAELLLEETRLRIARSQHASGGRPTIEVTPLSSRVLRFLAPPLLVGLALAGSLLATLGFALYARRSAFARRTAHVLVGSGLALLALGSGLALAKANHERTRTIAVVVRARVPVVDELGRPKNDHEPLAEGTTVEVLEKRGRLSRIATEFGSEWIESSTLRAISSD